MTRDEHLWLFHQGQHHDLHLFLGARPSCTGYEFSVWAPQAAEVSVVGDFNGWDPGTNRAERFGDGVWFASCPDAKTGQRYKYRVVTPSGEPVLKADPFGTLHEDAPATASVLHQSSHGWRDRRWIKGRMRPWESPISIYEVHLGSWRALDSTEPLYRAIAEPLIRYVVETGYTHVELLPVMEHPFYGSWGYQVTGYFAATARYGSPDDLRFLIDELHRAGIGVILDWVPAHFPADEHGLARFDGTALFEHPDPRRGWHPDWQTHVFDFDRPEVRSFLTSSAMYWLEEFHADGLRVDAVASMLYLDYSRNDGDWLPNEHGGNENLGAVSLLQKINEAVHARFPNVLMIAEESTAWPGVSHSTDRDGLGFGFKWDMGWMHDTLKFLARDPIHRRFHHDEITFRSVYASSENFVLALSHDEVVHLKGSIPKKMPGDEWHRLANVRLLYGLQWAQPGKKLLFMGMDFAQLSEWNHEAEVQWHLLDDPLHQGVLAWVSALNRLYRREPALYRFDSDARGVDWSQAGDSESSVFTIARLGLDNEKPIVAIANLTPTPRREYRVGVPSAGRWREVLNSDAERFGGSGVENRGRPKTEPVACGPYSQSLIVDLPPLGVVFWSPWGPRGAQ